MPTWPTIPTWSDPTEINKGNRYNARDGVTAADLNLIITNLMYLKEYGGLSEYSWLGEYVEGASYRTGAIVRYQGNIYLCVQDLDDQQDPTDAAYWQMLNTEIPEIGASIALNGLSEEEGSLTVAYTLAEKAVLPAATNKQLGVLLDANFIKSNIKSGESVFGLVGTYAGEAPEIYDGTIIIESGYTTISGSYLIDESKAYNALNSLSGVKTFEVNFSAGGSGSGMGDSKDFTSMTFDGTYGFIKYNDKAAFAMNGGFAEYNNNYGDGNGARVQFEEGTECRKEFKELFLSIADEYVEEETEDELAGTWVFDDYPTVLSGNAVWYVNFTSNNGNYDEITIQERPVGIWMWYNSTEVLSGGSAVDFTSWTSTAYKTITITSKLSEVTNGSALLTWLKANATKQGSKPLISFTIEGKTYQAEDGMTWGEWVESDYNTSTYALSGSIVYNGHGSWVQLNGQSCSGTDFIIDGATYVHVFASGSN